MYCIFLRADKRANDQMGPLIGTCMIEIDIQTLDSEAVLGVWLLAPLPTPRALPDHGAIWPLAVGVKKDLGGIDV